MFVKLSNSEILSLPPDITTNACKTTFDYWLSLCKPPDLPLFSSFGNSKARINEYLPCIGMVTFQTGTPVITYWGKTLEKNFRETLLTTEHLSNPPKHTCPITEPFLEVVESKKPAHLTLDAGNVGGKGIYEMLLLPIRWVSGRNKIKPFVMVVMDDFNLTGTECFEESTHA
jgi:hypothetical protein